MYMGGAMYEQSREGEDSGIASERRRSDRRREGLSQIKNRTGADREIAERGQRTMVLWQIDSSLTIKAVGALSIEPGFV